MGSHPHRRTRVGTRRRGQHGAAAVEFALVSVILFPILLGIIDYGLWFNDSLNARQGVREAARQGVVQTTLPTITGCSVAGDDYGKKLACVAKDQVGAVSGNTYAKVSIPSGWAKGSPLVVCTMIKSTGVTGITPLPANRWIRAKVQMSIEVDSPLPTNFNAAGQTRVTGTIPDSVWDTGC